MIDFEALMRETLLEAQASGESGEVPVGALVVFGGEIIARAGNIRESACDPAGHAEVIALRSAAKKLGSWNLQGCSLVVTLEPCLMCAGAILNSRIDQLVFGAFDSLAGAVGSRYNVLDDPRLNHRVDVVSGVLQTDCSSLLSRFFNERR